MQQPSHLTSRYRIEEHIGSGTSGAVFRATDLDLGREVAIKVLAQGSRNAAIRFQREAESLAQLRHPSIVGIHDRGASDTGDPFLVMDLLEGTSLDRVVERLAALRRDQSWPQVLASDWLAEFGIQGSEDNYVGLALRWIAQIGDGLHLAHQIGIVHRDIKPANIHIGRDGVARILDFGTAIRADDVTLTGAKDAAGSLAYMPPERLSGPSEADPRLDVYGLAATLYHLLAARPPYRGDVDAVLQALRRRAPRQLQDVHNVPKDVQAVVDCGMARDPRDRYQTAAEMVKDVEALSERQPVRARYHGRTRRALVAARRSRKLQVAVIGSLLIGGWLPYWSHLRAEEAQRQAEHRELWIGLPLDPSLAPNSRVDHPVLGTKLLANLDRMVELRPGHLPTRCLRLFWRFDSGDREGAVRDAETLAHDVPSEFMRGFVESLSVSDPIPVWRSLGRSLPEQHFLGAHLLLRIGANRRALALLATATDWNSAQLRLAIRAKMLHSAPDPVRAGQRLYMDAERFVREFGSVTTEVEFARAVGLLWMQDLDQAMRLTKRAIAVDSHSVLLGCTLGFISLELWRHEDAMKVFRASMELQPDHPLPRLGLAQALIENGRLAEAEALITDLGGRNNALLRFRIESSRALLELRSTSTVGRAPAVAALRAWAAVLPDSEDSLATGADRLIAEAMEVASKEPAGLVEFAIGRLLVGDVGDRNLLMLAAKALPKTPSEADTRLLQRLFGRLANHPGVDPRLGAIGPGPRTLELFPMPARGAGK